MRPKVCIGATLLSLMAGGCSSVFEEHEELCRRHARTIIYDPALWQVFVREGKKTYSDRAEQFPATGRVVPEYAPSFVEKFGPDLSDTPSTVDGSVVRQDLFIVKDGKRVAQFVNFYARADFAGSTIVSCFGSFPELYADESQLSALVPSKANDGR